MIEGDAEDYRGVQCLGRADAAENPAEFGGKAYSLLSVDGVLYTWRCGDTDGATSLDFQELYRSTNHSATWRSTGVKFTQSILPLRAIPASIVRSSCSSARTMTGRATTMSTPTRRNIQQAESLYPQVPGEVTLMRVPKNA